jgi:succinate dehydrogenase/fumarate reductase flavoprotein subunit
MNQRPKWLGEEPQFDVGEIREVYKTDVVVCGAGIAGIAAARSAVENGADVILIEKTATPQGRSGQFGIIGGQLLKSWGIDNEKEKNEIVNALMRESGYRAKQTILKFFADHIGEDFDWYLEGFPKEEAFIEKDPTVLGKKEVQVHISLMHYPFSPLYDRKKERYPFYPYTVAITPSHVPVMVNNMKMAMESGKLKFFPELPAIKLDRESKNGRINSVIARKNTGELVRLIANKGIVLATGDYAGNKEMFSYYCPASQDNPVMKMALVGKGQAGNTGDGHRMGMWAGAKMEDGPHCVNSHNMGTGMGVTPFLQLNSDGKRFMNEDCPGQQVENQINLQKGKMSWQIFDSKWREEIPYMPMGHGSCSHVLDKEAVKEGKKTANLLPFDGWASEDFLEDQVRNGRAVKADTLEELIEKMGIPKEEALQQIERYNTLAEKKMDEDFGKEGSRMFEIKEGPFYACKLTSAPVLCTHSGLESDEMAHCLDQDRNVIPGLYVCGNVQGNRMAVDYPTVLPGFSHAIALTFGREAGKNAALAR